MIIHHGGKMGDLVLALPAIRAYARINGPVDLVTSALCVPMVPLLWECSYIRDVQVDSTQAYEADGKILLQWEYFKNGEGINLSPQPLFREETAPYYYSDCYARVLGIPPEKHWDDYMIFPSLVNHRRWFKSHEVFYEGKSQNKEMTVVVAPECESVPAFSNWRWQGVINALSGNGYSVIVIGKNNISDDRFDRCTDLRGQTTIPTIARIIAEADALIGAHSFPMQLASRIEVPTICFQEMVPTLDRANPIFSDTVCVDPDKRKDHISYIINRIKEASCVSS